MKGIVRLGDLSNGHGTFPPRSNIQSSSKCFCDGIGIHRLGDTWAVHCSGTCHSGVASSSSQKSFADSIGIGRTGDTISCGDIMLQCSAKCFTA